MLFKIVLTSVVSIVITFLTVLVLFMKSDGFSIGSQIQFQTKDGSFKFTAIPSKGRDHKMMERLFEEYKVKNKSDRNMVLYRTTKKNYLSISKWCQYKGMYEWQYPLLR